METSGSLSSFCIACARFTAADRLGEALAVAAAIPYFVAYHAAVVLHARRELHMAFVFLGIVLTNGLSFGIKKLVKQPRPAATCALLGNCHKHGMPSSHSAVMAFAAATCLLLYRHRQQAAAAAAAQRPARSGRGAGSSGASGSSASKTGSSASQTSSKSGGFVDGLARAVELLEVQLLILATTVVAYGRVYLGYHSPAQVAAGLALGASFAAAWWQVTLAACGGRAGDALLRLPPLRALHMRNTLGLPDVHAAEAAVCAAAGSGGAGGLQRHAD